MSSVVADTHTIIWHLRNSSKLSVVAREMLDRAMQSDDLIYISAISFVEIIYLVEKGFLMQILLAFRILPQTFQ